MKNLNKKAREVCLTTPHGADFTVKLAGTALRRLRGLFFSDAPALMIVPCSSVHSIGFNRPLEVAYIDKDGQVLTVKDLKPWNMHMPVSKAHAVLEANPGLLGQWGIREGVRIILSGDT
ncbi:DUF192 domain-containing protein [Brevibacterium paucivorans]|uniref:DUF192 domain-containing protein n=1 Tax=Brevibacterium paucivorans TaxID=170994 RepID=UPI00321BD168